MSSIAWIHFSQVATSDTQSRTNSWNGERGQNTRNNTTLICLYPQERRPGFYEERVLRARLQAGKGHDEKRYLCLLYASLSTSTRFWKWKQHRIYRRIKSRKYPRKISAKCSWLCQLENWRWSMPNQDTSRWILGQNNSKFFAIIFDKFMVNLDFMWNFKAWFLCFLDFFQLTTCQNFRMSCVKFALPSS